MGGQSGLSELSVISWVSTIEGCHCSSASGIDLFERNSSVSRMTLSNCLKGIPQFAPLVCIFLTNQCSTSGVHLCFCSMKVCLGLNGHNINWMHNWKVVTIDRAHGKISSGVLDT